MMHVLGVNSYFNVVLLHIFSFLKEPRHLQFIAEFSDSDVYTLLSGKKVYGAPTDYGFCVKVIQCKDFQTLSFFKSHCVLTL